MVTLTGILEQVEGAVVLRLSQPICVDGDPASAVNRDAEADLSEIQVAPHGDGDKLGAFLGRQVTVVGTLVHSLSGHDRTAVLIRPRTLED